MLISIISVTYNDYSGLVKTIESIGNTVPRVNLNFEHIIIDGSSSDDTNLFLSSYIKNPHIPTKFVSESDRGIYDAMNKGVKIAEGKFCFFLNSGDLFDLNAELEKLQVFILENNDNLQLAGFAFNVKLLYRNSSIIIKSRKIRSWNLRMPSIHQGILYRTDYLRDYPYDEQLKICADFKSVLIALEFGLNFLSTDINFTILNLGGVSSQKPILLIRESSKIILASRFNFFSRMSSVFLVIIKVILFQIYFNTLKYLKQR